jgi:hypothetical protein
MAWAMLLWVFFRQHVHRPDEVYLRAGDEVMVTKAGQHTCGLDRVFSSRYGKPIPSLAFLAFSLVSIQAQRAFPMRVEYAGPYAGRGPRRKYGSKVCYGTDSYQKPTLSAIPTRNMSQTALLPPRHQLLRVVVPLGDTVGPSVGTSHRGGRGDSR